MRIQERTRVGYLHKEASYREEIDYLRSQLRRVTEKYSRAFDQGFNSAVTMAEAGATAERLREASGVVAYELCDTIPVFMDEEPTIVDHLVRF